MKKLRSDAPAAGSKAALPTMRYAAPALEKGLDILELFAREPEGLNKSEVARRLHRTTSEVFRMLVCLQRRGYISQGPDERYRLTLRLFELGQHHPPTRRLIREALPVMHDVARSTNQSCHLAAMDDGVVVILAQVDAPSTNGFSVKPGSQVDLMLAASGYVILAFQNEAMRQRHVELSRARGSRVPADLADHLQRIRKAGFEERASYQVEGVVNISFPVRDSHGEAIAAITVPFLPRLDTRVTDTHVVKQLRASAERLSAAMGWQRVPTKRAPGARPVRKAARPGRGQ